MTEDTILTDASLIRLRFENLDEDIGRSELRPTLGTDGRYTISGNNISLGGIWQIRATVQRPQKFDEVVDFEYFFTLPPVLPVHANHPQSPYRTSVLLLVGLGSLCSGGFFLGRRQSLGEGWIALTLMLMGAWFLMAILMH